MSHRKRISSLTPTNRGGASHSTLTTLGGWLCLIGVVSLSMIGCEIDEGPCTGSDRYCLREYGRGYACYNIDQETGEGQCWEVIAGRNCFYDNDCADQQVCERGMCTDAVSPPADEWPYVAIISTTTNLDDLDGTNTPGPDIDAIELIVNGESTFATTVEAFAQGAGGNEDGNVNAVVTSLTGPNDAIPLDGRDCDLSEGTGFWSMGDSTGFVVVSFGEVAPEDGNSIIVWELDDLVCPNVEVTQRGAYELFVGNGNIDISDVNSASDISGESWLFQGASLGGGQQEFTADLP